MSRTRSLLVLLACCAALLAPNGGRAAGNPSLPSVVEGPNPGPAALYAPASTSPLLENTGRWTAPPLMVSGAAAYKNGDFVYQDYLYDDYGANSSDVPFASPDQRIGASDLAFGAQTGDVVYPTDEARYGYNAADIVELRVDEDATTVGFRVTLNTLLQKGSTAIAIGIDADRNAGTGTNEWDHGLGVLGALGLEYIVYTDGVAAEMNEAPVTTSTDLVRNQIHVTVPRTATFNPGSATWRMYAVSGIANGTGGFRALANQPSATTPGGAHDTDAPPVFNVAFRFEKQGDEPMQNGGVSAEPGSRAVGWGHWREHAQAKALANRDISAFAADVDFSKILAASTDTSLVPTTGYFNRIYVSSENLGEGVAASRPWLLGKLQPYGIYVPTDYPTRVATEKPGLVLVLHSLSATYNQFAVFSPNTYEHLAQDRYAIAITPEGRGPDSWYLNSGELDVFETWADVARNYQLNADRVAINGYSMGGYGTYRLATLYPDLFGKAFPVVGPPGEGIWIGRGNPLGSSGSHTLTYDVLDNVRNIPFLIWNGVADELVPIAGVTVQSQKFDDLGYRHLFNVFAGDHFALATVDDWTRGRDFLGASSVDRDPMHVTLRVMPSTNDLTRGLVHDKAYWVWNVVTGTAATTGLVDVRSLAFGLDDPLSQPAAPGAGANPLPYVERGRLWNEPAPAPALNKLVVTLANVTSATIGTTRSRLNVTQPILLDVTSDGAATIVLRGAFAPSVQVVDGSGNPVPKSLSGDLLTISIAAGTSSLRVIP